ncbi:Uncharacterised protein [Mycobacteroides abscessus subsp. abscessus]|nr:Uncharacterised protein [Mycobacteroides abscessus subsp. abscessus]SIF91780.1 Uncharacterised protein [Mycobacteroides abscessus subsp. abscessus]
MLAVCDCERLTGGCEARLVPIWTMARSSSMGVPARGAVDGSEQMLCHLVEIAAGDEVGNEVRRVWRLVLDPVSPAHSRRQCVYGLAQTVTATPLFSSISGKMSMGFCCRRSSNIIIYAP